MQPVVRTVSFMVKSFFAIVVLLGATWCTVLIHFFAVYGTQEGITFAFVSVSFFALSAVWYTMTADSAYPPGLPL